MPDQPEVKICPDCREAYMSDEGHTCPEKMSENEYTRRLTELRDKGIAQD